MAMTDTEYLAFGEKHTPHLMEYRLRELFQHPFPIDSKGRFTRKTHRHIDPSTMAFITRSIRNLIFTLLFNIWMPFTDPLNFFLLITVYPFLVVALVVIDVVLQILVALGLNNIIQRWADQHGTGLTPVNWGMPFLFTQALVEPIIKPASLKLGSPPNLHNRKFDINVAQTLLLLSAAIYERSDDLSAKAHELAANNVAADDVKKVLAGSEKRIYQLADMWGMGFQGVSELKSLGGPFCGIFWSETQNFIVVVFKGTTPTNFGDFLVDATIQRVDARPFVFGDVHEGFYDSLFPANGATTSAAKACPYGSIIGAIKAKGDSLSKKFGQPCNVWVTGHSLGAAMATLFYARVLRAPEDLLPHCILRDGYTFGCPAIGDNNFAAEFASFSNKPFDNTSTLWRVIDDTDIITRLPPGYDDPSIHNFFGHQSILNYTHVGQALRFFRNGSKPIGYASVFEPGDRIVVVDALDDEGVEIASLKSQNAKRTSLSDTIAPAANLLSALNSTSNDEAAALMQDGQDADRQRKNQALMDFLAKDIKPTKSNPISVMEALLPRFFANHLPHNYFTSLQKARKYFQEKAPPSSSSSSSNLLSSVEHPSATKQEGNVSVENEKPVTPPTTTSPSVENSNKVSHKKNRKSSTSANRSANGKSTAFNSSN